MPGSECLCEQFICHSWHSCGVKVRALPWCSPCDMIGRSLDHKELSASTSELGPVSCCFLWDLENHLAEGLCDCLEKPSSVWRRSLKKCHVCTRVFQRGRREDGEESCERRDCRERHCLCSHPCGVLLPSWLLTPALRNEG